MKLIGIVGVGLLTVVVVAQGSYIVSTRREVNALKERLDAVSQGMAVSDRVHAGEGGGRAWVPSFVDSPSGNDNADQKVAPAPRGVPRFAAQDEAPASSNDSLPLPPAVDSPQSREQLRQFVVAQMQRQRDEERQQREARFEENRQRAQEKVSAALGLNADESRRFKELLANQQTAAREVREKVQSAQLPRSEMRNQMQALRTKGEADLRQLLGDQRLQKFETLRREDPEVAPLGMPRMGGREGGGPPWGGGPPPGIGAPASVATPAP
jgi:hypothetical protein